MADTLDEAIREAKVAAGLNPDKKYPSYEFCDYLAEKWSMPFWQRSLKIVFAQEGIDIDG